MAEIQNKPHLPQPQPSCFLGCFGFSNNFSEKKFYEAAKSGGRKKSRRFSWSRFRMEKSSNIKTVPVDVEPIKKTHSLKPKSKVKSKSDKLAGESEAPATGHQPPCQIVAAEAVTSDQISVEEPPQETTYKPAEDINLENGKHLDHSGFIRPDTSQKRLSFCRKIDAIRTGFSQPDSPFDTPNPIRNRNRAATTSLSHSASFPAPNLSKRGVSPPAPSRFTPQKTRKEQPREFDPVIGVSIITVTLIIMFLWGRLCAILCTSAWFYFVPRLRTGISSDDAMKNGSDPDLNSEEYKKKVVLEGFLERKHHNRNNSLVIL